MAAKKAVSAASKNTIEKLPAKSATAPVVSSTAVRNSPVPKAAPKAAAIAAVPAAAPAAKRAVAHADIARRAYEIYASGQGGSEADNWYRAERELRGV